MTTVLAAHPIVHVNASLNALATALLIAGLVLIKQGRIDAHKNTMLAAFTVSAVFLAGYLWYHYQVGSVKFTHPGGVRYVYYAILASHVLLAATVPLLAIVQIYLGFRAIGCCESRATGPETVARVAMYRKRHVRLARWVFPIWLYVSVTGVIVYVMLYHLWPATAQ